MKITLNFGKKDLFILLGIILVLGVVGFVKAATTSSINPGHAAETVAPGTFGADGSTTGDYVFPNNLNVNNDLSVDGNVGIGTDSPTKSIHISKPGSVGTRLESSDTGSYLATGVTGIGGASSITASDELDIYSSAGDMSLNAFLDSSSIPAQLANIDLIAEEVTVSKGLTVQGELTIGDHSLQNNPVDPVIPATNNDDTVCYDEINGLTIMCPSGYFVVGISFEKHPTESCMLLKPVCAKN